jgi:hypothetical protein
MFSTSEDGFVPPVDAFDLRRAWLLLRVNKLIAPHPALPPGYYEAACRNSDVVSTWCRVGVLNEICRGTPLEELAATGELPDKVFELAASFPVKRMDIPRTDFPFDRNEFLRQLGESA